MSKEEIEAKVAAILQPETLTKLKSSVWKERVQGKPLVMAAFLLLFQPLWHVPVC